MHNYYVKSVNVGPEKGRLCEQEYSIHTLLGGGVLCDGLGTFGNGVLG